MIVRLAWLLATLVPCAFADVKFTSPAAGTTVTLPTISVSWGESGVSPPISDFASYQLFLCAGGNDESDYIQLATLQSTGNFATGNSASARLTPGLGASVENAYFLKIISAAPGGTVVNFSGRFSISGMTGTFPPNVQRGVATVSGTTAGPPTQNNIGAVPAAGGQATAVATGNFAVPYTLQTGEIRYAPMPPVPPTKITAKGQSRQWPTSAYTVYPTVTGPPNAATTVTLPITFSASSVENPASPAEQPTDTAMARFLNRWKD